MHMTLRRTRHIEMGVMCRPQHPSSLLSPPRPSRLNLDLDLNPTEGNGAGKAILHEGPTY